MSTEEAQLPVSRPRSHAEGPPRGFVATTVAIALAVAGLTLLVAGSDRGEQPLTIMGAGALALSLGAMLYWRAALIAYWHQANRSTDQ